MSIGKPRIMLAGFAALIGISVAPIDGQSQAAVGDNMTLAQMQLDAGRAKQSNPIGTKQSNPIGTKQRRKTKGIILEKDKDRGTKGIILHKRQRK